MYSSESTCADVRTLAPDVAAILPNAVWREWLIAVGYQLTRRLQPSVRPTNSRAQCLNVQYVKLGDSSSSSRRRSHCIEFCMTREPLNPQPSHGSNLPWLEFSVAALGIGAIQSQWFSCEALMRVCIVVLGLDKYTMSRVFNKKPNCSVWETSQRFILIIYLNLVWEFMTYFFVPSKASISNVNVQWFPFRTVQRDELLYVGLMTLRYDLSNVQFVIERGKHFR